MCSLQVGKKRLSKFVLLQKLFKLMRLCYLTFEQVFLFNWLKVSLVEETPTYAAQKCCRLVTSRRFCKTCVASVCKMKNVIEGCVV